MTSTSTDFVAIDLETANPDYASICQVGMARYVDGAVTQEWVSYVDPGDDFDPVNVAIHGITPEMVRGAPTVGRAAAQIRDWLDGSIAVCHTHFDRVALERAFRRRRLKRPACTWLDSARVARRTWEDCAYRNYGLERLCAALGYEYKAHDALEDAKAAGNVLLRACAETGVTVHEWLERIEQPIPFDSPERRTGTVKRDGDPDGPLYGEVLTFTGALAMTRHVAADVAARLGCKVTVGVTKRTTILVVGDQDVRRLRGHEKSAKHLRAEEMIGQGQQIRIIGESAFLELAELAGGPSVA